MTREMTTYSLLIEGRVQGVCYRAWMREKASKLAVAGWVRNLPSGQVEALVKGEEAVIDELITMCNNGPPLAAVTRVTKRETNADQFESGFYIRY